MPVSLSRGRRRNVNPSLRSTGIFLLILVIGTSGYMLLHGGDAVIPDEPERTESERYDTTETDWDDYMWPTNAGHTRTSDFAEFRSTHFHAGIDISTGGKTGYDIYAARAGWLHSAYFEPAGYGWFLVLRHADGYHTCYAHLERYSDRVLNAFREQLRKDDRSYGYVRWTDDTVRVSKGEVIAYSGKTGAGPAHIHFEVRDRDFNPVNPGLSRNLRPRDSIPPEMRQLCIVPLDASSSVDGKFDQQMYRVAGGGSSWRVKAVPVISGRAGLMLRAHDRANTASDYPTPYKITLYADGKEILSTVSNRFSDSLGFHIRIDRDNALMRKKKGELRKLYREEGNVLETYWPRDIEAGVLSAAHLGAGEKRLMVIAEDLSGNRSMLTVTVLIESDMQLEHKQSGSVLTMYTNDACRQLLIEEKGTRGWDLLRRWDADMAMRGTELDLARYRGRTLRAVTIDSTGNSTVQGYWTPGVGKRSAGRLYTKHYIHFDEIIYDLKLAVPFAAPPKVEIAQAGVVKPGRVFPFAPDHYRAVLPTWPGFAGAGEVRVTYSAGRNPITWTDKVEGFHISAAYGGQLRSPDGRFVMSFAPNDVYRSMLCILTPSSDSVGTRWNVGPSDIPLAGRPLVSILPSKRSASMMVTAPRPTKNYGKVDIPNSPAVAGRFGRWLGSYGLLQDDVGPEISAGFAFRSREPIRIHVSDNASGVDWSSIAVYIDKFLVPVEYDERRDVLFVPYDVYKDIGKGMLTIRAKDRLGNVSVFKKNM